MREQKTKSSLAKFSAITSIGVALVTILLYVTQTWKIWFPDSDPPQPDNFVYTGKVLDAKIKQPIKNASVEIQTNGVPTNFLTTNNGIFRFEFSDKAIAGRLDITVIVTCSGYERYRELKTLLINEKDIHEIYLERVSLRSGPVPVPIVPPPAKFYEVTLQVGANMSHAKIFVDGEPALRLEDSSTVTFKKIRVQAKNSNHTITLRNGSFSCSKEILIQRAGLIINFTDEDCQ